MLKAQITPGEYATLSDSDKAHYPTADNKGNYTADIQKVGGLALEDVGGLRSALEKTRNEKSQFIDKLKSFEGLENPDAARDAIAKLEDMKSWTPETEVQARIDAQITDLKSKYETDLTAANEKLSIAELGFERYLIEGAASANISKVAPKSLKVLLPHVASQLGVFEQDGEKVVLVKGSDGNPRITTLAGQTGNMQVAELLDTMSKEDDYATVFPGSGATGSGIAGSGTGAGNRGHANNPDLPYGEALRELRRQQSN
jgi:hypothetical protein